MKVGLLVSVCVCALVAFTGSACNSPQCCLAQTETIAIYDNDTIPANAGISTGVYTEVDGYRYVNVLVEFQQDAAAEEPVSLGVVFAHASDGKWGARSYFNFDENFTAPADPQMITLSGRASWHGSPQNKSSYIGRLPVMGPYVQVFPFNHHDEARIFSVVLYLSD